MLKWHENSQISQIYKLIATKRNLLETILIDYGSIRYFFLCRLHAKLERAEINPKKRMSTNTYDSSADVFKLDLVYKDRNGVEHELKWLVKVTR